MNYETLLAKLYNVNFFSGSKLGLKNMQELSHHLGYPEKQFPSIHVAGTNGKGSVSTKIAAAFQKEGFKTGLFTSPHIASFRERVQINGKIISEHDVKELLEPLLELGGTATFFELTTALAFTYFAREKVDIAVIEVGLGGRLDATNIITPKLSIITSISLEHCEILGNTIEAITKEKAGIIKPGVPVVIGPRVPLNHTQAIRVEGHFAHYDEENSAVAKKALELLSVSKDSIAHGLAVRPPCRMEKIGRVTLDVAHNPDGFKELAKHFHSKKHIVLGLSKTKDIRACLLHLIPLARSFYLTEADNGRGLSPQELKNHLVSLGVPSCDIHIGDLSQALEQEGDIMVTGTFFIMQKARKQLGLSDPSDPIDLNEKLIKRH